MPRIRQDTRIDIIGLVLSHLEQAKGVSKRNERLLDSSSLYSVVRQELGLDFETDLIRRSDAR
jgi:hypothetical protein